MSNVRIFKVPYRIARLALGGGGISARMAVKQADAALNELRPSLVEAIDEHLAEIERRFGVSAASRASEPLADLYTLGVDVIDVCDGLPGSGVDEAAKALCDLVDRSLSRDVTNWEAIDVHLRALHLLRAHGLSFSAEQKESVLVGLKQVTIKQMADDETTQVSDLTG